MWLWGLFVAFLALAIGFDWVARHPDSDSASALRRYFWGPPGLHAVTLYLFALFALLLIILRACCVDIPELWDDFGQSGEIVASPEES